VDHLNDLTSKATPTVGDSVGIIDAAASNASKKATISSILALDAAFTKLFTSSGQTITFGGALTLAHGLGTTPTLVQCRLKCTAPDGNYSVNDEVLLNYSPGDGGTNNGGVGSIVVDSTNVNVRYISSGILLANKSTGSIFNITAANWNLIVRAWA
jgi:hypothetical protein